jgi:hypothetical protein
VSVAARALTGILNALFFASTLAARTEYAPSGARGQVFIRVAALRFTSGSAGTALAGSLTGVTVRLPPVVGILAASASAVASVASASAAFAPAAAAVVAATVETRFAGVDAKHL